MSRLRVFTFKDKNNNSVEVTAPSKTQARKFVERAYSGFGVLRYDSDRVETENEFIAHYGRDKQRAVAREQQAAVPKAERCRKVYDPNDRCPCGSGKKFKRCCGRRRSSAPKR